MTFSSKVMVKRIKPTYKWRQRNIYFCSLISWVWYSAIIVPTLFNTVFVNRAIGLCVECSPVVQETKVQSQVELYQKLKKKKWYLVRPCLTLSIIRYGSRVKWSNPGNGVAPSPTPWCSSYWKGSLRVTLD